MDYQSFDDYWQPLLGGQGPVGAYVWASAQEQQRWGANACDWPISPAAATVCDR